MAQISTRDNSRSVTPASPKRVRPFTTSKKQERQALLDSLAQKRRRITRGADPSPEESIESDFVVSDNEVESERSSSDAESVQGPSFYARISNMMDKKDNKEKSIAESFSTRGAFRYLIRYYAICLVSPGCEYPINDKALRKELPTLKAAVKKLERELEARRDIARSNYWKPDSDIQIALDSRSEIKFRPVRHHWDTQDEVCDSCHRKGWSVEAELKGFLYDSKSLWKGDVKKWLKQLRLPILHPTSGNETLSDSSESDGSTPAPGPAVDHLILGSNCAGNTFVYHRLQHSKHHIILPLYRWIVQNRLASSIPALVEALNQERDGIVEMWFDKYEGFIATSETQYETATDPLGTTSPPPLPRPKVAKAKRRNSSRF